MEVSYLIFNVADYAIQRLYTYSVVKVVTLGGASTGFVTLGQTYAFQAEIIHYAAKFENKQLCVCQNQHYQDEYINTTCLDLSVAKQSNPR